MNPILGYYVKIGPDPSLSQNLTLVDMRKVFCSESWCPSSELCDKVLQSSIGLALFVASNGALCWARATVLFQTLSSLPFNPSIDEISFQAFHYWHGAQTSRRSRYSIESHPGTNDFFGRSWTAAGLHNPVCLVSFMIGNKGVCNMFRMWAIDIFLTKYSFNIGHPDESFLYRKVLNRAEFSYRIFKRWFVVQLPYRITNFCSCGYSCQNKQLQKLHWPPKEKNYVFCNRFMCPTQLFLRSQTYLGQTVITNLFVLNSLSVRQISDVRWCIFSFSFCSIGSVAQLDLILADSQIILWFRRVQADDIHWALKHFSCVQHYIYSSLTLYHFGGCPWPQRRTINRII